MPRYFSLHTLACLTRQGAEELAARLHAAQDFQVQRVVVNMTEGKMLVEYEAADRDAVAGWLARENFHHDAFWRAEFEFRQGAFAPLD